MSFSYRLASSGGLRRTVRVSVPLVAVSDRMPALQRSFSVASHFLRSQSPTRIGMSSFDRPSPIYASPALVLPIMRSFQLRSFQSSAGFFQRQNDQDAKTDQAGQKEKKEEKEGTEEKKAPPPPPPHGDKSPWQVFTDTLRSEFKASKEWNESTKALASSAHQFAENENVKRARQAYEQASQQATSRTSSVVKKSGKAIGSGAAWTWDTSVVKGLRSGVSATGKGLNRVTRPVRETEAYKSAVGGVKEAMDDGSSSRYGGWIEKDERRRQRQLREQKAALSGKRAEVIKEDPK